MKKIRVLHLGYQHVENDIRIVQKECASLFRAGYEVYYATANCQTGVCATEGVTLIPIKQKNKTPLVNYIINKELDKEYYSIIDRVKPEVIHIHEYGISYLVKKIKKHFPKIQVIYDAHEDNATLSYEKDIDQYGKVLSEILRFLRRKKEKEAFLNADYVITATEHINELYHHNCKQVETITNYPIITNPSNTVEREKIVCFAGVINERRDSTILIECSKFLKGELHLAGPIDGNYIDEQKKINEDSYERKWFYHGILSDREVKELYAKSMVGVCLYKKEINTYWAMPNKLFEYMEAGIPIIASDFPLWKEIVEGNECGFCVNEESHDEIIEKINYLFDNPDIAYRMGQNGRNAVEKCYNWDVEKVKLLQIYSNLVNGRGDA